MTLRLYVAAPLEPNAEIVLAAAQLHHLRNVMRAKPGDIVLLFNGSDGEYQATLEKLERNNGIARCVRQTRPQQPEPDLSLLFAPIKRERIDWLVEKATEIGVSRLQPVITERTIVQRLNFERLTAHAILAAEQCERLTMPTILAPLSLHQAINVFLPDQTLFWADETHNGRDFATALQSGPRQGPTALLIGPEGGFTAAELDFLREIAFVTPVSLGPRLLRADTAALAGLAIIQAWRGDWQRGMD